MSDLSDRDYSETFSVELEWREWNRIWSLCKQGMDKKENDDWPEEELDEDREIVDTLNHEIGENNPGNGIEDWPNSMKQAYNETIMEMLQDE